VVLALDGAAFVESTAGSSAEKLVFMIFILLFHNKS
jgi:hypothetical protein